MQENDSVMLSQIQTVQLSSLISTRISQISVSSGHNSVPVTYHKQWYNSSGTNLGDLVIAGNISGWGRLQALAGSTTDQCLGMSHTKNFPKPHSF